MAYDKKKYYLGIGRGGDVAAITTITGEEATPDVYNPDLEDYCFIQFLEFDFKEHRDFCEEIWMSARAKLSDEDRKKLNRYEYYQQLLDEAYASRRG